jgi:hypothetical protein
LALQSSTQSPLQVLNACFLTDELYAAAYKSTGKRLQGKVVEVAISAHASENTQHAFSAACVKKRLTMHLVRMRQKIPGMHLALRALKNTRHAFSACLCS